MRTKRSKAYKKAMALYTNAFKFREPYQVLCDAAFVQSIAKQKVELVSRLADVLGGTVKPSGCARGSYRISLTMYYQ